MANDLHSWFKKWHVPAEAQAELTAIFFAGEPMSGAGESGGEMAIVKQARGTAGARGMRLWRNNSGALLDKRGVPVRFGLGNDSKRTNELFKSSDLIGIDRTPITLDMVGQPRGQFLAFEGKEPGWQYRGTPREVAQLRFLRVVAAYGGRAMFFTDPDAL